MSSCLLHKIFFSSDCSAIWRICFMHWFVSCWDRLSRVRYFKFDGYWFSSSMPNYISIIYYIFCGVDCNSHRWSIFCINFIDFSLHRCWLSVCIKYDANEKRDFFWKKFCVKPYVPREPRRDPSNRRLVFWLAEPKGIWNVIGWILSQTSYGFKCR